MSRPIEEVLTEYHTLISGDHHKDRDCHFSISRDYSYGKLKGYVLHHDGYCNMIKPYGWSDYFTTYKEAEEALISIVEGWITEEKYIYDSELRDTF